MTANRDLSNALARVFDDKPTYEPTNYIVSAIGEIRRTLTASNEHEVRSLYEDAKLPSWLGSGRHLGPYERILLADLISAREGLIVFRGGTGSGKSSVLYRLKRYVDHAFTNNKKATDVASSCLGLSDLQDLSPQLIDERTDIAARDAQTDALFFEIARRIEVATDALLKGTGSSLADLAEAALAVADDADGTGGWQVVAREMRDSLSVTENRERWSVARFRHEKPYLKPDDLCRAALLPLVELGRRLRAKGHRLLLVVDNMDHIPNYLQNTLAQFLARAIETSLWRESAFSVVLSMRLSSSSDPIAALAHYVWRTHDAPDPAQIVYLRVTQALLNQEAKLGSTGREAAPKDLELRLVAFWLRLSDRDGRMYQVLSGIAGTNIRNALLHAKAWCLSDELEYVDLPQNELQRFRKELPRAVAEPMLQEIAASAARAIASVLSRAWKEGRERNVGPIPEQIVTRVCDVVFDVLRDARVLEGGDGDGTRCVVGRKVSQALIDYAADARSTEASWPQLIAELKKGLPRSDEREYLEIGRQIFSAGESAIGPLLQRRPELGALGVFLGTLVCKAGEEVFGGESRSRDSALTLGNRARTELRHVIQALERPSRYNSNRLLLEEELEEQDIDCRAANLVADRDGGLCGAGLRIVYRLAERRRIPFTIGSLVSDLKSEGFDRDSYRNALDDFIGVSRRLVYSRVNDHARGVDRLLDEPNAAIHLSWAGRLYLEELLETPAYLQWALSSPTQPVERVLGRLARTKTALNTLAEEEFVRFKTRWSEASPSSWRSEMIEDSLKVRSAATDVIVRSLGEFLSDIRRNMQKISRTAPLPTDKSRRRQSEDHKQTVASLARLAEEWWRLALLWIERYRAIFKLDPIFDAVVDEWTARLTTAEDELHRIRRLQADTTRS